MWEPDIKNEVGDLERIATHYDKNLPMVGTTYTGRSWGRIWWGENRFSEFACATTASRRDERRQQPRR